MRKLVKNTHKRFSIFVIALLLLIGIAAGIPNITNYAPESPVSNIEGGTRDFNIDLNQTVNVSWYINGTLLGNTYNDSYSTYTIKDAVAGTWIVNATATNENGTVSMQWTWIVRRYGVNLTVDSTSRTSSAGINASYLLVVQNNGTVTDAYLLSVVNADRASTAALNISENITLESGASQSLILNVTNISSGIFSVNVTATSDGDATKFAHINTITQVTDITPPASITNLIVNAYAQTYINWAWTEPEDQDFSKVMVYINGIFQTNVTKGTQFYNTQGLTASTVYTIGTRTVDTYGNTNNSWVNNTQTTASNLPPVLTNITVLPFAATVTSGKSQVFTATPIDQYGNIMSAGISWISSNTTVGTVEATGVFTALEVGISTIKATSGTVIGSSTATVIAGALTDIILTPGNVTINISQAQQFNATGIDANGNDVPVYPVWSSNNTSVGIINETTGIFIALAAGTISITVTDGNISTNATITVLAPTPTPSAGAPIITGFAPSSPVSDIVGSSRTFNFTSNQTVNVTWYINDTAIFNQISVTDSSYTSASALEGTWIINATANNINGTVSNEWTWIVMSYGVNLTADPTSRTSNAGMNASYVLILQNNGTTADTYSLTVVNANNASTAALDMSEITLESGASKAILLNVTNTSAGVFYMNVTALSNNDPTKVGYINTTTTVNNATGSVNGTVTDIWLSTPIANVTITLTNTTGGTIDGETDSNGYYNISGIVTSISNPYIYTISASKTNYTTNSCLTVTALNSTTSNTTNITLRAYIGTLTGSYIKNGTSIEVSGATVNITNSTFGSIIRTTDSSGSYFASLYPAIYTINVSKTGYSSNNTSSTVSSNLSTTVSTISLSPNTVTVTANRTVGSAESGQNVSFNLTVINTGDDATFSVTTSVTNANVSNTIIPFPLLLNTGNSTGYVVVEVNNSNFGGWPVTITISNSSQSKSAGVTLTSIMRNSSANYTNDSISVIDNASVSGGATLTNTTIQNATVIGAALENSTVQNGANVSGNDMSITNAIVTGENAQITDGTVIRGDYDDSNIDNSTVGTATVDSSDLTGSTISGNAWVSNSTLTGATVDNSTLDNVTVSSTSTITNVASLSNITLGGVTVTGDSNFEYEGKITGGNGWVIYQNINFSKIYETIRISQLVIEQSQDINVTSGTNISINDTSLGTSMNFSMIVNLSNPAVINISEMGISPDGVGFSSGTMLGNFLVIRSNDTLNVTKHILRLYFDTDPSTYTGGVSIYYYDTATSAWEALTTTGSGTEGGRYYREAQPNHFSTFMLVGTTINKPTTSGGGSSDAGVVTSEPYDNIAMSETYKNDLVSDKPVVYTFKLAQHGIYEITVTGKEIENNIALRVEALKGPTMIAGISAPPGTVYKNVNVWPGSKNIKKGLIKFKVENTWISDNKVESGDLLLVKWDGSKWVKLVTLETMKDDRYSFYEANTDSFPSFAITALKGAVVPAATQVAEDMDKTGTQVKPAGTENPVPTKKISGYEAIIVMFAIVLLAACLRQYLK